MWRALLLCTLALGAGAAASQTLYRCGPAGRDFSQAPCAGGQKLAVEPHRPSSTEQGTARQVAQNDARLAERLAQERRAREATPITPAAGFHPAPARDEPAPVGKKKKKPKKKKGASADPA